MSDDDDDDDTILICMRVADWGNPVSGARQAKCDLCGAAVWFSPSAPKHDKKLCMHCAGDTVEPQAKFQPITKQQMEEVIAHLKKLAN